MIIEMVILVHGRVAVDHLEIAPHLRDVMRVGRRGDAALARHHEIHQQDVGEEFPGATHGFFAVLGLADDLHVGLEADERPEAHAHERMVVGEKDGGFPLFHVVGMSWRRVMAVRVPRPGAESSSNVPSSRRTRSRMP